MNSSFFACFSRVIFSKPALAVEDGARLYSMAVQANVDLHVYDSDTKVLLDTEEKRLSSTLQVLYRPARGWIEPSEHGSLQTRPGEYYAHPIIGCRARCTYCYLQAQREGRIPLRFHVGMDDFFEELATLLDTAFGRKVFIATGELGDSLADAELFPVGAKMAA
ncbi:MAG: hypothetical protein GY852_08620, partial [bacterium]|nr:hypothetical protein [bacterium]